MTIIDQVNQAHLQKRRTFSQDGGAVAFLLYQNQKNATRARQRNSVRYMLESFQKQIKYGNQIKSSHPRICILKMNQRTVLPQNRDCTVYRFEWNVKCIKPQTRVKVFCYAEYHILGEGLNGKQIRSFRSLLELHQSYFNETNELLFF